MAIRYDDKLNNEIRSIVNRYNAKIRRLEKGNKDNITIPDRFDRQAVKSLKESVSNRTDLRRRLKDLETFTKRGGESNITIKGVTLPKYEYQNIKRYRSLLKRRITIREKFLKQTKPSTRGIESEFTLAQQFNEEVANLNALKTSLLDRSFLDMNKEQRALYLGKLQRNTKTFNLNQWQRNYIDMLLYTGYLGSIGNDKLDHIKDKLMNLSPKKFDELFKTESTIKQILYYYRQVSDLGVDVAFESNDDDIKRIYEVLYEDIDDLVKDYE